MDLDHKTSLYKGLINLKVNSVMYKNYPSQKATPLVDTNSLAQNW